MDSKTAIPTGPQSEDLDSARDELMRRPDDIANWFGAQCFQAPRVPDMRRLVDYTAEDFKHHPVGMLLVLAMSLSQPLGTRCAAMDAVRERFLADPANAAALLTLADEAAVARIQQEREDAFEANEERWAA